MRIIASDSSCLIDLGKGGLLASFLELPFELVIPDVLLDEELLSFSPAEVSLVTSKMTVATLDGEGVEHAAEVVEEMPALSFYDAFALIVAEQRRGSILLTGDRRPRSLAEARTIEVHGVLWVVEQIEAHQKAGRATLLDALTIWRSDPAMRLPRVELADDRAPSRQAIGCRTIRCGNRGSASSSASPRCPIR